jgi:hypothetical protein
VRTRKPNPATPRKANVEWLVYRVGGPPRAAFLGNVSAPDHVTALARACEEFDITSPTEQRRLIVLATSSPE